MFYEQVRLYCIGNKTWNQTSLETPRKNPPLIITWSSTVVDYAPWESLLDLVSSSVKWCHKTYKVGLLYGLNEIICKVSKTHLAYNKNSVESNCFFFFLI